jgi:Zn-dependent protease
MLIRWRGLHVRLHMFFLLFAAFTLFLSSSRSTVAGTSDFGIAVGFLAILLISVLLHELGHYFTAVHFGGDGRLLVLWPLGGLCPLQPPLDPRHELAMHVAGPLVNLGLCVVSGIGVATLAGSEWIGLLHPLAPRDLLGAAQTSVVLQACKLTFWVNWVLVLANLLPAFPFDGGRALRSALIAMHPDIRARRAAFLVATLAKLAALVLLVVAALWWKDQTNPLVPVWFPLVLLALFLYFSAKQEEEKGEESEADEEFFGYDFSQGYTSLERTSAAPQETVSPFRRWLDERRQARQLREKQIEADEERRVDEILSRLHEQGMDSLSADDRSLLKRVSQRLRHKQESGE